MEEVNRLPAGMRRFNELDLARPFFLRFCGASSAIVLGFFFLAWFVFSATNSPWMALFSLLPSLPLVWWLYQSTSLLHVPLAVDLNHPFMDGDPMGKSVVMIQMVDGSWIDLGNGRVRLAEDDLLDGCNLVRDNDDYTHIGHFSRHPMTHRGIKKQVVILNQALALRDAVNGEEDTIEEARRRERLDTGLLDRSWMEEETEIEIDPDGIISKFRGE